MITVVCERDMMIGCHDDDAIWFGIGVKHQYAIFSAQYLPHVGGVESYTKNLAHELVREGNRVCVVTSLLDGSRAHEVEDDGVEVVRLPCANLMDGRLPILRRSRACKHQLARLDDLGIDRVLVNTRFYRHSLEGLRFAHDRNIPVVLLDHGSAYLSMGSALKDGVLRMYEHAITRLCLRYGARYAGVSRMSTQWLLTFGIETSEIVPNAIDAPAYRALASCRDFRAELGLKEGQVLVVFVGRLAPEKGIMQLAQAAQTLGPSFVFACAGEGPLRDRVSAMGLTNVSLLGNLSKPDLSALLSQGDVFCLPSRSEGFCTSLLEAGAWGLVPVITHVGGVDELLGCPARYGRILPSMEADAVVAALHDVINKNEQGHNVDFMRSVEREHAWEDSARALEMCFEMPKRS